MRALDYDGTYYQVGRVSSKVAAKPHIPVYFAALSGRIAAGKHAACMRLG